MFWPYRNLSRCTNGIYHVYGESADHFVYSLSLSKNKIIQPYVQKFGALLENNDKIVIWGSYDEPNKPEVVILLLQT